MNELPNCANKHNGCNNKARVLFAGKLYCGECVVKWHKAKNEIVQTEMEEVWQYSSILKQVKKAPETDSIKI